MEVRCNLNNFYTKSKQPQMYGVFRSSVPKLNTGANKIKDVFVKRPDATKSASGLSGLKNKLVNGILSIINYGKSYKKNIQHTYDHKIIFALIEKELYGHHTIDSYTHDADKMFLYLLGFPKSFVSKFHREHSAHHVESGKKINLSSMLCDNIASSPEFKPEKKNSLREYYAKSKELQSVSGFEELLEKYHFGENLDFDKIKEMKTSKFKGLDGLVRVAGKALLLLFVNN